MREDVRTAAGVEAGRATGVEAGRATGGDDGRATGVEVGGATGVGGGTASAIYRGAVLHSRHAVAQHRFQYGIAMVYLDLDELPSLLGGALLDGSLRVLRFRREDYFGDPAKPLAGEVRDRVEMETGMRPAGPIRLLTQLRSFGHCFNPVSIYYCLGQDGAKIDALLAEVTNTPWGERHAYVLQPAKPPMPAASSAAGPATGSVAKALHVSPFIGMDQTYEWRATVPGDTLSVRFTSRRSAPGAPGAVSSRAGAPGAVDFEASLSLARVPLTKRSLASITAKYPAATIRVLGLIYLQAAKLRLEGVPVQPHRGHRDGVARTLVFRLLRRISAGRLVVLEAGRRTVFGVDDGLTATVEVHSPKAWRLLLRGSQGLAESYAQRLWDSPDLTAVIAIAACNAHKLDAARRALAPMLRPAQTAREMLLRNTRERSKRDIAAHYDIGDDLFELMLDPTMMYSCALFQRPGMTLQEASLAKLDHICRKLALGEGERVIEIGGGWGGFAIHAAQSTGCHVTTTTISESQYRRIKRRVQEAGLQDRVTVLRSDYRDLRGSYDRLVSIEMIEAVGWRRLPLFFARCSELLKRDGVMLLQAIAIDDRAYEVEKAGKSFVNTYIFPNGCLPSMEAIRRNVSRKTDLSIVDVEDITAHYVETLKRWRQSFEAAAAKLSSLGYDERFRRIWKLYLSYCEAGFLSRRILDYQVLLEKPQASSLAPPASPCSSPSSLGGSFPPVINGAGGTRK